MQFDPTPDPWDTTPEQLEWVRRYVALIPRIEDRSEDSLYWFESLCDHVLQHRYGSFAVVAQTLDVAEPNIEILPFLVPITEELLDLVDSGRIVETDEAWVLVDPTPEEIDRFGLTHGA